MPLPQIRADQIHELNYSAEDLGTRISEIETRTYGLTAPVADLNRLTGFTAAAANLNNAIADAGKRAVAVIDFNTGAAEAGCSITIGGVIYQEADAADADNGIWTNGASAANSATSFAAAINGDTRETAAPFGAVVCQANESVILIANSVGAAGNVTISTTSAARVTVENAHDGADPGVKTIFATNYVVTDQDVLATEVNIPIPWAPSAFTLQYVDATGAPKTPTDLVSYIPAADGVPDRVRITKTGGTNLIATDIVFIWALSA